MLAPLFLLDMEEVIETATILLLLVGAKVIKIIQVLGP